MAKLKGGESLGPKLAAIGKGIASGDSVRIGFLEGSTYFNGLPVAMIALINDYGAPSRGQPPRPFFRNMIAAHKAEWPAAIARNLKDNDYDAAKALDQIGAAVAGQLRQSIQDLWSPPLAESTIRKKGFEKPLIGGKTANSPGGHMYQSVDYEVKTR